MRKGSGTPTCLCEAALRKRMVVGMLELAHGARDIKLAGKGRELTSASCGFGYCALGASLLNRSGMCLYGVASRRAGQACS